MRHLQIPRWLVVIFAILAGYSFPLKLCAQVSAGSGSYATAFETPIYNDNGFFGPTVPQMQSAYNTLYLVSSLKSSAIPTDQWWSDLMFGFRGSGTWTQQAPWNTQLWVLPQVVEPTSGGMQIYYPSGWNSRSGAAESFNIGAPISVTGTTNGHSFTASNPVVKSYGDWTLSYAETDNNGGGTVTTTLARGVPFVWVQYSNVTPQISGGAFYDVNGNQITTSSYTGSAVATVVGGMAFGIYAPSGTTFSISGSTLTPNISSSSYLVYAVLPDKSYLSTFAQYAYAMPTASKMTYTYNHAAGQIQTTWTLTLSALNGSSNTSTLQGFLPHHYRTTTNNLSFQSYTYLTPRGTLKLCAGSSFAIAWPFRGIAPVLPAPHANNTTNDYCASRMQQYVDAFASAHPTFAGDTYAQGQELGLGAQHLTMATQLGLTTDKNAILSSLEKVMNDWYTYTPGEGGSTGSSARYFVRDTKYGSFIGDVPGFGTESFNDNHFHYGYFTLASALTGMSDSTWLTNYLPVITMVAKDYANWDRTDTTYPYLRHFDIWEGHCWANGVSTIIGENQESSSESMQSWVGLFMLGNMSSNQAMADAGAMGYAIESSAVNEYWQDWKKTNLPSSYGYLGAGQVLSGQVLYSTNFGGDPAWIYGIQFCPTNHWNNYLVRDTSYAASVLNNLWTERTKASGEGFFTLSDTNNSLGVLGSRPGDYWLGYQAMFDPSTAATEMDQYWTGNLAAADDGEMAGPVYYLTHTLRALGLQDLNYYTDIPTSQVFYNSTTGQRTVVIYNPQTSAQTATVYNNGASVTSLSVPAKALVSVVLTSGSGAPIAPTGVTATPGNNQVQLSWIEPSTQPAIAVTSYNVYRSTTSGGEGTTPYVSGLTTSSYTDTNVTNGTTYYYKVAAVNSSGTSALSGEASCKPAIPSTAVTDPLNDFSLVNSKSSNWSLDTGNSTYFNGDTSRAMRTTDDTEYLIYKYNNITGFSVRTFFLGGSVSQVSFNVSTDNGATWTSVPILNGVASAGQAGWYYFNLSNNGALPTGVTNLKIQLGSGSGNAWDPQISQVTIYYQGNGSAPSAPSGLSASAGNALVTLSWSAASAATSYSVYRSTTSGGEGTTPIASGITSTTYTDTSLTNGTTYYYKIAAVNSYGTSPLSAEVNATPQVPAPTTPTGLTATAGNAQAALSWSASTYATSYNVYRSTTSGGEGTTPIASGITSTSYTNTGLTNGTKYYFTVAAVNSTGTSAQSSEVNATPTGSTTVTDYLNDWTISSGHSTNWVLDSSNPTYFSGDTSRATRTVDDTEYIIYTFSGISTFNAMVYTWNGPVTVATFWYSTNNGSSWTQASVNYGSKTSVSSGWGYYNVVPSSSIPSSVTNLKVQFTSGTGNGWDPQLSQITLTYGGSTVTIPAVPTGLTATAGNAQVSLSWTSSSGATSYNVYRGTTAGGESSTAVASGITSTSYTNTGLTNGTTYYYKVAAVNSAGASSLSSEASATPTSGQTSGAVSINCGGSASGSFIADADYSASSTGSTTSSVATPYVSSPIPNQAVLQSWRTGTFTYTLPGFTAGTGHTVSLYFMEPTATATGQRTFNVSINASAVLTNFDIYAAAGGQLRAVQENFNATANSSGQIAISFTTGSAGSPIIEGITVN